MEQKRVTPERITELGENEVFVFGSNLAGAHGGGAALLAYRKFGAIWGQGVGLQGKSYGIPTMHGGVDAIRLGTRAISVSWSPNTVSPAAISSVVYSPAMAP